MSSAKCCPFCLSFNVLTGTGTVKQPRKMWVNTWSEFHRAYDTTTTIRGYPKGPYQPCISMAGRALLAGYHQIQTTKHKHICAYFTSHTVTMQSGLPAKGQPFLKYPTSSHYRHQQLHLVNRLGMSLARKKITKSNISGMSHIPTNYINKFLVIQISQLSCCEDVDLCIMYVILPSIIVNTGVNGINEITDSEEIFFLPMYQKMQ